MNPHINKRGLRKEIRITFRMDEEVYESLVAHVRGSSEYATASELIRAAIIQHIADADPSYLDQLKEYTWDLKRLIHLLTAVDLSHPVIASSELRRFLHHLDNYKYLLEKVELAMKDQEILMISSGAFD